METQVYATAVEDDRFATQDTLNPNYNIPEPEYEPFFELENQVESLQSTLTPHAIKYTVNSNGYCHEFP